MMSALGDLVPGASHWPRFVRNRSEQFEARLVQVEIARSPSLFFRGMEGSRLPVATAHGEGYAEFRDEAHLAAARPLVSLRFVDGRGRPTEAYPHNPNGSPEGITGLTTADGRFTILMPHPERVWRTAQLSWAPRSGARLRRGSRCSRTRAARSGKLGATHVLDSGGDCDEAQGLLDRRPGSGGRSRRRSCIPPRC